MRKIVGYLEGTDSVWLTTLNARGHTTLPLSNGFDGHGMNIGMLNKQNKIDLLIGYLHKLLPAEGIDVTMAGMLHATTVYGIPVLVVCPTGIEGAARGADRRDTGQCPVRGSVGIARRRAAGPGLAAGRRRH